MTAEPAGNAGQVKSSRLPGWVIVLALAVLAGFLALIGSSLVRKSSPPIRVGDLIPDLTFTSFSGETYRLADLKGNVVLINFWASWCTTCEDEAVALQTVWQEMQPGGRVVFLGVDWADTEPEARAYLNRFGITYPSGPDLGTRISQRFRITGVPETYLFDTSGHLASVTIGPFSSAEEIRTAVGKAMK